MVDFDKQAENRAVCEEYNLKTKNYSRKIAPRNSIFDLRTEAMRTDEGKPKKGRLFSTVHGLKEGGIRIDEMIYGLKMAHISCTDDGEDRLVGSSPNSLAALEKLIGGDEPEVTSKLPLSQILKECFDLNLDCWIDESGFRKGRAIDTQGFIASNEDTIVLSYRFSTTLFDWLANLSLTSSEWLTDKDEALGHAGIFSSARGWWTKICKPSKSRPRVHTAYYNNFIYTIPQIRKYIIEPLLKDIKSGENVKPKKIYVAGCSLGAAISQIAFCFILDELYPQLKDPEYKRVDRLISVTAGCPRIGDKKFRKYIMDKMAVLRKLDRAVICRLVYNVDIVPHAPPNILNFRHLDKLVYITKGGKNFIVNPDLSKKFTKWGEIKTIYTTLFQKKKEEVNEKTKVVAEKTKESLENAKAKAKNAMPSTMEFGAKPEETKAIEEGKEEKEEKEEKKTPFELECEGAAEVIHDHMPFWYMFYLEKLKDEQDALHATMSAETIAEA